MAFVDETGSVVPSDVISVLCARYLLRDNAGAKVVYDIKMSDIVRRTVLESRGVPILERSGHTFLKRRMITDSCLFGCEVSGHYFFREDDPDSPAWSRVWALVSLSNWKLRRTTGC